MINIRVFYQKTDRLKYISHLDINRCMQRALKRADLPLWYTEGFNPHIYITFALPLSLGFESHYEIMDTRLTKEMDLQQVKDAINSSLPNGLKVTDVCLPEQKPDKIAMADYDIKIYSTVTKDLYKAFDEFINQDCVLVQKKAKKGFKTVDIKREIINFKIEDKKDYLLFEVTLPAGISKNINPSLIIEEFKKQHSSLVAKCSYLKKTLRCEDGSAFK